MGWLRNLFAALSGRNKKSDQWDNARYTDKPSTKGDDFRNMNQS